MRSPFAIGLRRLAGTDGACPPRRSGSSRFAAGGSRRGRRGETRCPRGKFRRAPSKRPGKPAGGRPTDTGCWIRARWSTSGASTGAVETPRLPGVGPARAGRGAMRFAGRRPARRAVFRQTTVIPITAFVSCASSRRRPRPGHRVRRFRPGRRRRGCLAESRHADHHPGRARIPHHAQPRRRPRHRRSLAQHRRDDRGRGSRACSAATSRCGPRCASTPARKPSS